MIISSCPSASSSGIQFERKNWNYRNIVSLIHISTSEKKKDTVVNGTEQQNQIPPVSLLMKAVGEVSEAAIQRKYWPHSQDEWKYLGAYA